MKERKLEKEKPKFENARKLHGTYFIEPADKAFAVKVNFTSLMGMCHLKNAELVKKHHIY